MTFRPAPLKALYLAQFLSAFVDNMILFIAQAIIVRDAYPSYYLALVQGTFLFSYIILSPWVGRFADKQAKAHVLITGNLVKAAGVLLLAANCDPALGYAVVGIGAVIYSPAKYGILPFLTRDDDSLLRANSSLESYTILAILSGAVAGGYLSDISVGLSLTVAVLLYGTSILVNTFIPKDPGNPSVSYRRAIRSFRSDAAKLFANPQGHYSLVGTGSFWMASAVLRLIIFAWLPLTLGINSGTKVSLIIAVTGVGIAVGAFITPWLITLRTYRRTMWFGLAMAACIAAFLFIKTLFLTVAFLLLAGCFGGIYIVPMNACLQQVGQAGIGAGKTIAIQNFVENTFMFLGVAAYMLAGKAGVDINISLGGAAFCLLLLVAYLYVFSRLIDAKKMSQARISQ